MEFFKHLEKIGISRQDLKEARSLDVIRIQKLLLAESSLDATLHRNDIYSITDILTNHAPEIEQLAYDEGLYNILDNKPATYYRQSQSLQEHRAGLYALINHYFKDAVINYINTAIPTSDWAGLYILLQYKAFTGEFYTNTLTNRLESCFETGYAVLQQHPHHKMLYSKASFFINKDFYVVLGLTNRNYFTPHLNRLLKFVQLAGSYTNGRTYFDKMLTAMREFNPADRAFQHTMFHNITKYGGRKKYVYYAFFGTLAFIFFLVLLLVPKPTDPSMRPRTNFWKNEQNGGILSKDMYDKEERKIAWLNFLEARETPVTNAAVFKLQAYKPLKYAQPFSLWLFSGYKEVLMQKQEKLLIFNDTDKECVVIAYNSPFIRHAQYYALYLPAHDSLKIDFINYKINLYTGNNLSAFNNYRHYVYADSTDLKFSSFNKVDVALLKNDIYIKDTVYTKPKCLVLTRPDNSSYRINWDGNQDILPAELRVSDSLASPGSKEYIIR